MYTSYKHPNTFLVIVPGVRLRNASELVTVDGRYMSTLMNEWMNE